MMVMNAIDSVLAPTVNVPMGTTIGQNVAKNSRVDAPDTTRTTPVIPIPIDTMTATITPMMMVVTIGVRVGSVVVVTVPESNVVGTRVVGINVETEKTAATDANNVADNDRIDTAEMNVVPSMEIPDDTIKRHKSVMRYGPPTVVTGRPSVVPIAEMIGPKTPTNWATETRAITISNEIGRAHV